MILIRPVTQEDTNSLEQIAIEAGTGMTTLPRDRALLKQKIQRSIDSFGTPIDTPGEELYWCVMEDTLSGQVVGSSAIYAGSGRSHPVYSLSSSIVLGHSDELKFEILTDPDIIE